MPDPQERLLATCPSTREDGAWREHDLLAEAAALCHMGCWAHSVSTRAFWWSDELYRILGLQPGEIPATQDALIARVHPDDRACVAQLLGSIDQHMPEVASHRILRADGAVRHVRSRARVRRGPDGEPADVLGIVLDITEEHALRVALADSEERYRQLAENAYDVIWTMELDGTITYVSPSVERVRGITPEEARRQRLDQIHPPESAARVTDYFVRLHAAIANGSAPPTFLGEQEYYRKDGSIMVGELQVIPQIHADGHVVRILGVTRDISELRRHEQELDHIATTDVLTGVWNRRRGERLLATDLAESRRLGTPVSLLVLDIDHFKSVNDTRGHDVGDRVLVALCRRLEEALRPSDVLVRWGGEEFVVLSRHCTLDAAIALARKLLQRVASTPFAEAGTITISIGVAELHGDDDSERWMHRADQALYDAKAAGRNTVCARD